MIEREVLKLPAGSFKVTMDDPNGTQVTVNVDELLHFTIHHCNKGMEFLQCVEIPTFTTENCPSYIRDEVWCNLYREIVYTLWNVNDKNREVLRTYCKIKEEY